jgi:hypothetical protein
VIVLLLTTGLTNAEEPKPEARPGWYGVFPPIANYQRTYQPPTIDAKAKDVYSQTVRYDWTGNDFRVFTVTLARNPEFKKTYAAESLKLDKLNPTESKVGTNKAWNWELVKPGQGGIDKPNSRMVVVLADDKVLIIEATGSPMAAQFPALSGIAIDKLTAHLDKAPITKNRTLEAFQMIPKGATFQELTEWVGQPKEDIGSGIHIMVFPLDDGSTVKVGTPDLAKLMYIKHTDKDGKTTDVLK